MPLIKRAVEPTGLCHQPIPSNITNELECVTNNALSNVILQLSSLSLHAEDVFGELFTEASAFYSKANELQGRIDQLSKKIIGLDSSVEEVSLHDINKRRGFKSSLKTDQQVVSRDTMLKAMREAYQLADKPPPLQNLNRFRNDDRDALKIYTDPDYFFNLWREAMQKELRDAKEKRREQRRRERKSDPNYRQERKVKIAIAKARLQAKQMELGEEFIGMTSVSRVRNHNTPLRPMQTSPYSTSHCSNSTSVQSIRSSPSVVPNYSDVIRDDSNFSPRYSPQPRQSPRHYEPPPEYNYLPEPPAPPTDHYNYNVKPISSPISMLQRVATSTPSPPPFPAAPTPPLDLPPPPPIPETESLPPPPPPPFEPASPPSVESSSPPEFQSEMAKQLASVRLNKVSDEAKSAPAIDSRSELLRAITVGHTLRKVDKQEKIPGPTFTGNDVASILARRVAIWLSDSESDSFSSVDDSEWNED